MLPTLLLLSTLAGSDPLRAEISLAGSGEDLSRPDGIVWEDGEAGMLLRQGAWRGGGALRGVDRYDIGDGEIRLLVGRESPRWGWEGGATRGIEERFLPTWSAWTSAHALFMKRWNVGLAQKTSFFPNLVDIQPEASINLYAGRFLFGLSAKQPVADGEPLDPGGQFLSEFSWSDDGAVRIVLSRNSEAEKSGTNGILTTRVTSLSLSLRQRILRSTTLRCGATWTRQGSIHDRMGAGLGIAHEFAI